jgi:hypothetical protein
MNMLVGPGLTTLFSGVLFEWTCLEIRVNTVQLLDTVI